jgi:hypothetical protein
MNVGIAISILIKMPSKGGFPFSGKSRAIDICDHFLLKYKQSSATDEVDCTHLKRK